MTIEQNYNQDLYAPLRINTRRQIEFEPVGTRMKMQEKKKQHTILRGSINNLIWSTGVAFIEMYQGLQ